MEYVRKTRIGGRVFGTNIFLAPLSGCSDLAFRLMSRRSGAKFCFFEMVSSNALVRNSKKTLDSLRNVEEDSPVAAQILGSDAGMMLDAAKKILEIMEVSFIDINAACPVRKVVKNGQGAALLKKPEQLYGIIRKLSLNLPVPVTVKLRTGFDRPDIRKITDVVKRCEDSGASCLFVHGRTREQGFSGEVDYQAIRKIKKNAGIPVFGSGNILNPVLARRMFDETACDGVLVARGAMGSPWIFKAIEEYFTTGRILQLPAVEIRIETLKEHLSLVEKYSVQPVAARTGFMKKVALWYLKDFPGSARGRAEATSAENYEQLLKIIVGLKTKFLT